ncbi:hypothetical protein KJ766_00560 [Patescibacteria group bacterium]|nr:hypothetical protein [Patescibacteria group bacterium]
MFFLKKSDKNLKISDYLNVVLVFIAVVAMGLFFRFAQRAEVEFAYRPIEVEGSSVTVENQTKPDKVVLGAILPSSGFITVHESLSGAPAEVIGVSEFIESGIYGGYIIDLSQNMIEGSRYITLLHLDDGDGIFDMNNDLPVMSGGAVVRPDFVFTGEKEEEI